MKDEKQFEVVGDIRIKQPKPKKKKKKKTSTSETPLVIKIFVWFMFIAMLASSLGTLIYWFISMLQA